MAFPFFRPTRESRHRKRRRRALRDMPFWLLRDIGVELQPERARFPLQLLW